MLRAIQADRGVLASLSSAQRRELLTLAGLVAKPERDELRRMAKAFRRHDRLAERRQDQQALETAGLRVQRRRETYAPLWLPPPAAQGAGARPQLGSARACYVCKQPYSDVHRYYDSMCTPCGDFNYAKRLQSANLHGRVALVTGARVKIGYQAALMLLRAGAQVVVGTRTTVHVATSYAQEPDYPDICVRLRPLHHDSSPP